MRAALLSVLMLGALTVMGVSIYSATASGKYPTTDGYGISTHYDASSINATP